MKRKILTTLSMIVIGGLALGAAGCTSTGEPYGLTGSDTSQVLKDRVRYSDDKGHYHPEWKSNPSAYPVKTVK